MKLKQLNPIFKHPHDVSYLTRQQVDELVEMIDFILSFHGKEYLFFKMMNNCLYNKECKTLTELFDRIRDSSITEVSKIIRNFPKFLVMDLFHYSFKIDNLNSETGINEYYYHFPDIKLSETSNSELLKARHVVVENKSTIFKHNKALNDLFDNIKFNDIFNHLYLILVSDHKKLFIPSMKYTEYKGLKIFDTIAMFCFPYEYTVKGKDMVQEYFEFEKKKREISFQDIENFKKFLDNEYFVIRFLDELRTALFLKEWVGGKSLADADKLAYSIAFN